jgi:hypothetical protein
MAHTSAIPRPYFAYQLPRPQELARITRPPKACSLGRFRAEMGLFGAQNRINLTKSDHGFEVVLLILNGLSGLLRPK